MLIGGAFGKDTNNVETVTKAPFDMVYAYLHGVPPPDPSCYTYDTACGNSTCNTGSWICWSSGTWNNYTNLGGYVSWWKNNAHVTTNSLGTAVIRHWTWYTMQDIGKAAGVANESLEALALQRQDLLTRYLNDYRYFLQQIGSNTVTVDLEPDFWGFARSTSNSDPKSFTIPLQQANPTDCASESNDLTGLASCLINMTRKYAPNAKVGLHVSCWDYGTANGARNCLSYYQALGADKGDFLVTDAADRDAGWVQLNRTNSDGTPDMSYWLTDAQFAQYFSFIKTMTEGVGKPMIIWQIPLGNMRQNNTDYHYQAQWVDYLFSHMNDVANAHVAALLFGAGDTYQTSPETDGDNLINKTIQYRQSGGVPLNW